MCKANIIGLKNENNLNQYRFFLKENHSKECLIYYQKWTGAQNFETIIENNFINENIKISKNNDNVEIEKSFSTLDHNKESNKKNKSNDNIINNDKKKKIKIKI